MPFVCLCVGPSAMTGFFMPNVGTIFLLNHFNTGIQVTRVGGKNCSNVCKYWFFPPRTLETDFDKTNAYMNMNVFT